MSWRHFPQGMCYMNINERTFTALGCRLNSTCKSLDPEYHLQALVSHRVQCQAGRFCHEHPSAPMFGSPAGPVFSLPPARKPRTLAPAATGLWRWGGLLAAWVLKRCSFHLRKIYGSLTAVLLLSSQAINLSGAAKELPLGGQRSGCRCGRQSPHPHRVIAIRLLCCCWCPPI